MLPWGQSLWVNSSTTGGLSAPSKPMPSYKGIVAEPDRRILCKVCLTLYLFWSPMVNEKPPQRPRTQPSVAPLKLHRTRLRNIRIFLGFFGLGLSPSPIRGFRFEVLTREVDGRKRKGKLGFRTYRHSFSRFKSLVCVCVLWISWKLVCYLYRRRTSKCTHEFGLKQYYYSYVSFIIKVLTLIS